MYPALVRIILCSSYVEMQMGAVDKKGQEEGVVATDDPYYLNTHSVTTPVALTAFI